MKISVNPRLEQDVVIGEASSWESVQQFVERSFSSGTYISPMEYEENE